MNALSPFERFKERLIGKVDVIRGQCWFFHRWNSWIVTNRRNILRIDNSALIGHCISQERQCSRCGITQIRTDKVITI